MVSQDRESSPEDALASSGELSTSQGVSRCPIKPDGFRKSDIVFAGQGLSLWGKAHSVGGGNPCSGIVPENEPDIWHDRAPDNT